MSADPKDNSLPPDLKASGAVIPPEALPELAQIMAANHPVDTTVTQIIVPPASWHPAAIQKLINFFEVQGQVKGVVRKPDEAGAWRTYITVAFKDQAQANRFLCAIQRDQALFHNCAFNADAPNPPLTR